MPTLISTITVPMVVQALVDREASPPKIQWMNALQIGAFAYETGAVIGRALADRGALLERLLADVEREGWLLQIACEEATKRRELFPGEPCFWTLVMRGELAKVNLTLEETREPAVRDALLAPVAAEKMLESIEALGLEGVGFGMLYPDTTATMYRAVNEHLDHETIKATTAYGIALPLPPEPYALERREVDSLSIVAQYVRAHHAEIEDEFGLGHLLK